MAPIRLTHRARADLAEIGRYIARDNPPRARAFLMDIHRTADAYADHPEKTAETLTFVTNFEGAKNVAIVVGAS